jgi:DNA-binding transcriptional MerR regulator
MPNVTVMEPRPVSTTELARALGLSPRSIQRYVTDGLITPDFTTPGGHYRWNVDRVREQLRALPGRGDDE